MSEQFYLVIQSVVATKCLQATAGHGRGCGEDLSNFNVQTNAYAMAELTIIRCLGLVRIAIEEGNDVQITLRVPS